MYEKEKRKSKKITNNVSYFGEGNSKKKHSHTQKHTNPNMVHKHTHTRARANNSARNARGINTTQS